ncbi:MAG: S41 family peptidase [Woeseiaceae bacterium]|nr:S41 family peptidase [Woeseiaceae bacterium]
MTSTVLRSLIIASIVLVLAGCGGGGGGGGGGFTNPPPPPPDTGWQSGVFQDESNFARSCAVPGNSINLNTCQPVTDIQGSVLDENNFLRSWSNRTYLWYDEIVDRDPGLYNDPLDYFDLLKTTALSPTGAPKDKFHFTDNSLEYCQLSQGGVSAGYGVTWAFLSTIPPREILVAYTEPGTPATDNSLLRGAQVLEIDGVDINDNTQAGVDIINDGLFPASLAESHDFTVQDPDGTIRTITMVSQEITVATVQNTNVIDTPTGRVGYMTFNAFRAPSEEALIDAINTLNQGAGIDDLVLDLRYNGGGFGDIASQLGYMIAGPTATAGRIFLLDQYNDKHPITDIFGRPIEPTPFYDETRGFSVAPGQPLPSLNLPRVFVLTGGRTASASEVLMNGLRGVGVQVIQIGSTTSGKPYGFFPQENCGTTYFSIQFRAVNDLDYGDFTDGFSPAAVDDGEANVLGCQVDDDFSEQLGSTAEDRLEVALAYQAGRGCVAPVLGVPDGAAGKPGSALRGKEPVIYRSFFDSNLILRRP